MSNYHRMNEERRMTVFFKKWSYVQSLYITSTAPEQLTQLKSFIDILDSDLKINGLKNSKSTNETIENLKKNAIIRILSIDSENQEYKNLDY